MFDGIDESQSYSVVEVPIGVSFFALGGHSLSVGQLVNRIRREVKIPQACITDVYAAATVQQLAARLAEYDSKDPKDPKDELIEEADGKLASEECQCYPASYQQLSLERMASLSAKASSALNLTFCCHVRGPLDVDCLQQAFTAVQMRHDALRTTLKEGQCHVSDDPCLDFSTTPQPAELAEWLLQKQYETFDLQKGPLCRVRLIEESASVAGSQDVAAVVTLLSIMVSINGIHQWCFMTVFISISYHLHDECGEWRVSKRATID